MPMVTPRPHPRVMLVKPPWIVSPGFLVGNRTTIATTPVPNRIRTNVPRNSAMSSAVKVGFEVIAPPRTGFRNSEVVYQGRNIKGIFKSGQFVGRSGAAGEDARRTAAGTAALRIA